MSSGKAPLLPSFPPLPQPQPQPQPQGCNSLFRIGEQVTVDQIDRAYITAIYNQFVQSSEQENGQNSENGQDSDVSITTLVDLQYVIGGHVVNGVEIERLRLVSTNENCASRSGLNRHSDVVQHDELGASSVAITSTEGRTRTHEQWYKWLKDAMNDTKKWTFESYKEGKAHPLYTLLKQQKDNERPKGWLRISTPFYNGNEKGHLNQKEQVLLTLMYCSMSNIPSKYGLCSGWVGLMMYAWDISRKTVIGATSSILENDICTQNRKTRTDKGASIFNSDKIRARTFTAYNTFKKKKTAEFGHSYHRDPVAKVKRDFASLSESEKNDLQIEADRDHQRAKTLFDELKDFLLKCKGRVTYRSMHNHLGRIVCMTTIFCYLAQLEGWRMRKDRLLPLLGKAAKIKRWTWSESWWLFWKFVRTIPADKAVFVLVHMDEKLFFAICPRCNTKVLESIGLMPNDLYVHHKSYVEKTMFVVVTAYVLKGNDITGGGTAVPISCIRVGRVRPARKSTFKRVVDDDGKITYPQIEENRLCRKGLDYFEKLELTGNSDGTESKPKVSLLRLYKEQIIPDLEAKIVNVFNDNGKRRVIIVKQEDGAGLHTCQGYLAGMREEFRKRDWILFNQPPQSPITNVHDACIFPMLSKLVSQEQSMRFGSMFLVEEQINSCVRKAFFDETHVAAMSRAFAAQSQIVSAIRSEEGGNKYLTSSTGLSFGIRKHFVVDEDGKGVTPVDSIAPSSFEETASGQIHNEAVAHRERRGLKYEEPDIKSLHRSRITPEMKRVLLQFMDIEKINDDMLDAWNECISRSNH